METTALFELLATLTPAERAAAARWLRSPAHNHRADVGQLFALLTRRSEKAWPSKPEIFKRLFSGVSYDNRRLNLVFTWLAAALEDFLAWRDWQSDAAQTSMHRGRALRQRGLEHPFERVHRRLSERQQQQPYRHGAFFRLEYERHNERFAAENLRPRADTGEMARVAGQSLTALHAFFALETLRWLCTAESLRAQGAVVDTPPLADAVLADAVLAYAAGVRAAEQPSVALLYHSYRALAAPDDELNFKELKSLIRQHAGLFPPSERRDIYMAAINFCIRRHNRGEATYTREAFELYRTALDAGLLFEHGGTLPRSTYTNVHNLAHLVGEHSWARAFLDEYAPRLPAAERDNTYRFNLATYHFRRGHYAEVLELLRDTDFPERFMNLDARKMLLRAYFERGEWLALDSLLDSFDAYLRRQKRSGYHLESYRNLVRFTRKLARSGPNPRLVEQISTTEALAERTWLLQKVKG